MVAPDHLRHISANLAGVTEKLGSCKQSTASFESNARIVCGMRAHFGVRCQMGLCELRH
jgi:hypothetical protein